MKTIIIEGMSCQKCVEGVKKALNTVDGVEIKDVVIGKAVVEGSNAAELKEALEDFGYDVVSIEE